MTTQKTQEKLVFGMNMIMFISMIFGLINITSMLLFILDVITIGYLAIISLFSFLIVLITVFLTYPWVHGTDGCSKNTFTNRQNIDYSSDTINGSFGDGTLPSIQDPFDILIGR